MNSDDEQLRAAGVFGARLLKHPPLSEIRKLLSDDSIHIVKWACVAIEDTGNDAVNALPELRVLLYDERKSHSRCAHRTLKHIALTEKKAALILNEFKMRKANR